MTISGTTGVNAPRDQRQPHEPERQDDQRNDVQVEPIADAVAAEHKSEVLYTVLDVAIDGAVTVVTSVFDGI